MRKHLNQNILYIIGAITLIVWATGFFGFRGIGHTLLIMGLITVGLILTFVVIITQDDFFN